MLFYIIQYYTSHLLKNHYLNQYFISSMIYLVLATHTLAFFYIYNKNIQNNRLTLSNNHINQVDQKQIKLFIKNHHQKIENQVQLTLQQLFSKQLPSIQVLRIPLENLLKRKGKKIRPILSILISSLCSCNNNQSKTEQKQKIIQKIGILIQFLHNSSLIIDDIEDNSLQRRNQDCIHIIYGEKQSICSANYMYFKFFQQILKNLDPDLKIKFLEIFFQQMTLQHFGQAEDIFYNKVSSFTQKQFYKLIPSENSYIRYIVSKTGSLLRMMIKFLCCIHSTDAKTQQILVEFIQNFAIAFQIKDDIMNITTNLGKGIIGEDLKAKKLTLLVLRSLKEDNVFLRNFLKKNQSQEQLNVLIQYLKNNGSIDYAKEKCKQYSLAAIRKLKQLPNIKARHILQHIISEYLF